VPRKIPPDVAHLEWLNLHNPSHGRQIAADSAAEMRLTTHVPCWDSV
jgi:hypothetical protein